MSKITFADTASGYNLQAINQNFTKIAAALNNGVLWRMNPKGEPNQMVLSNLDMNFNRILNLPIPINENDPARLKDVTDAIAGAKTAALTLFSPYGAITSTNVQGAIQQTEDQIVSLQNRKGPAMASNLGVVNAETLQAALDSFGPGGGILWIDNDINIPVDGNVTVPPACAIISCRFYSGSPGSNASAPYDDMKGALRIGAGFSITVGSSAQVIGCLVAPSALTFPQETAANFAGTAFIITGDDAVLSGCSIMGFNLGIKVDGAQRPKLYDLNLDNVNNIDVTNCKDVGQIKKIHSWPFATIAMQPVNSNYSVRNGTNIKIHNNVDWINIKDCFAYDYDYCYVVSSAEQVTLDNVKTDGGFVLSAGTGRANTVGILVEGNSHLTRIINPQINTQQFGIVVNTTPGIGFVTSIEGGGIFSSGSPTGPTFSGAGLLVENGNVKVGTTFHFHSNAIRITSNTAVVSVEDNCYFDQVAQVYLLDVSTSNLFIKNPIHGPGIINGQQVVVGDLTVPTLSSATGGLALPMNGKFFFVDSANNVGDVSGWWPGREVFLSWLGTNTVFSIVDGIKTHIRLTNNTNWTANSGAVLHLIHDGSRWREVGRTT